MAKIDTYKSLLGSGGRDGRFLIQLRIPELVTGSLTSGGGLLNALQDIAGQGNRIEILANSINFPPPRKVPSAKVYYHGQQLEIPVDRGDYESTITLKFKNEERFDTYRILLKWMALFGTNRFDSPNPKLVDDHSQLNELKSLKTTSEGDYVKINDWKSAATNMSIFLLDPRWAKSLYCNCIDCYPSSLSNIDLDRSDNKIVDTTVSFTVGFTQYYGYSKSLV